jgi:hypothetical protein
VVGVDDNRVVDGRGTGRAARTEFHLGASSREQTTFVAVCIL